ncbi:hypothetical protein [Roseicitreum antarcticum]|uniref:hypothetical protein n=1 Tax=Roseicitreum antarcticum TaxID=564137 RepID=UPI0016809FAB|nr:hypothetical protein [Roseicitreum antarcticum]
MAEHEAIKSKDARSDRQNEADEAQGGGMIYRKYEFPLSIRLQRSGLLKSPGARRPPCMTR